MKNRNQKLMLVIIKVLGIIVCVLVAIILIIVTALLYFENHDFSYINVFDKKEFSCYRGELEIRGTVFVPSPSHDYPLYRQGADPPGRQGYTCEYLRLPKGCRSIRSSRGGCTLSDYPRRQAYFPYY